MGSLPGCGDGGWRRIASFDRRAGQTCPRGFVDFHKHGRIACSHSGTGCQSVTFPAGQSYTRVCGRVQGYGIATPDAFFRYGKGNINDINSAYLDGVSITYGHPRKHLWSYAATFKNPSNLLIICPCTGRSTARPSVPPFVGNNYYCEGGGGVGVGNVLWDCKHCSNFEAGTCCRRPNAPWFYRVIGRTSAAIELRLCTDQPASDEQVPIFQYELYVQ